MEREKIKLQNIPKIKSFSVLIGAPASGKSTFSKMLNTMGDTAYTVVNQDELHTRLEFKCIRLCNTEAFI